MLVITRREGETVRIGSGVVVRIVRTARGSVRIAIEAPADVEIARGELPQRKTVEEAADRADV
jgi:carbon storage regulator